jgi:hypothetical protein
MASNSSSSEHGLTRLFSNPALATLVLVGGLLMTATAAAQGGRQPTLSDLSLRWAEGEFASPLICQIDGRPMRGIRRISIAPPDRPERPPVMRITFTDLETENASRCFTELAGDVPNVLGWIHIRLPGRHRTDTAQRDFRDALRRKRGFEFDITSGKVGIQPVTQPPTDVKLHRFTGGKARLIVIEPGSDSAKLLGGFPTPRKLLLELENRGGAKLSFPLYVPEAK